MNAPSRIVDAHQHAFWHGRDDAGLIADMDEHGIEYAWLLTWEIAPSEHNEGYLKVLNPTRVRAVYPKGPVQAPGRVHHLLEKYDNLSADLSAGSARFALERDSEHAQKFLTDFSTKLLFARDYYGGDLHAFLTSLNLSDETRENLYWRNAEKLVPKS